MNTSIEIIATVSIDINSITTYGELKQVLPSTGTGRVPGINQLRGKAALILRRETESGVIEIYDNGFFIFEECGHPTVFGVDRCERPETYTYSGKRESFMEIPDFSSYPWELILESAGSARLAHNGESREEYQEGISIDAPESENNIELSVRPEHEIREEEENAARRKAEMLRMMREGLKGLKPRQVEILELRYGEGLTFEEIAERMGITKGTAFTNCERALKKAQKKILQA
jgi:RNA polymerase sigma factor (sigma-70 family)